MNIACITTLNEEATIGRLIRQLTSLGGFGRVVVADGGSEDRTRLHALEAGRDRVVLLDMTSDVGGTTEIGACLRAAWREALSLGADYIVQLDAGGSHHTSDSARLLRTLKRQGHSVVVGSRFMPGSRYDASRAPWWRPLGSCAMSVLLSAITGYRHTDWTSGYRAFTREALQLLASYEDWHWQLTMHGWQAEVVALAESVGLLVGEAPITYTAGRSSFRWRRVPELLRAAWRWRRWPS